MSIYEEYKNEVTKMKYNGYAHRYLPFNLTKDDLSINNIPYAVLRLDPAAEDTDEMRELKVNGEPYLKYIHNEGKYDCILNMNDAVTWYENLVHKKVAISNIGGFIYYVKAIDYPLHQVFVYEFVDEDMYMGYGISASVPAMIENARTLTQMGHLKNNVFDYLDNDLRAGMLSLVLAYAKILFGRGLQKSEFTGLSRLTLLDRDTLDFKLNSYDYEKMMENKDKFNKMTIREALEFNYRFGIFFRTDKVGWLKK